MIIRTKEKGYTKRHMITVGEQAISLGKQRDASHCPIAQALRLYGCYCVGVNKNWISYCYGGVTYNFPANPRIRKIIKQYDYTGVMEPFTFYIKL